MSEETLTRVPTSVNDHRALLADVLAAKTYDDDFDVKYLTKETRNGPELRTQGAPLQSTLGSRSSIAMNGTTGIRSCASFCRMPSTTSASSTHMASACRG